MTWDLEEVLCSLLDEGVDQSTKKIPDGGAICRQLAGLPATHQIREGQRETSVEL